MLDCGDGRCNTAGEPVRSGVPVLVGTALLVLAGVLSAVLCYERQRGETIWVLTPAMMDIASSPNCLTTKDCDDQQLEEVRRPFGEHQLSPIGQSGGHPTSERGERRAPGLEDKHGNFAGRRRRRQIKQHPHTIDLESNRASRRLEGHVGAPFVEESYAFQANNISFLQDHGAFRMPGNGISFQAVGEPKSGTTWLGRLVLQLALNLCGSPNNAWCQMGGISIKPNKPAPWYEFEMLNKTVSEHSNTSEPVLFLHYRGHPKHKIAGMDAQLNKEHKECANGGRRHKNSFEEDPPCYSGEPPTRERLSACLWDTSPRCLPFLSNIDPAVSRNVVIFRDPRDVIISEYRMRTTVYMTQKVMELTLEEYTRRRFEVLVSWIHQRWIWHNSEAVAPSSHVVYYENCKESPDSLMGIAAFMGLDCTPEQARRAWDAHHISSSGNFATNPDLTKDAIEWMTGIMAMLLPPPLALLWGVTPTDLPPN